MGWGGEGARSAIRWSKLIEQFSKKWAFEILISIHTAICTYALTTTHNIFTDSYIHKHSQRYQFMNTKIVRTHIIYIYVRLKMKN